MGERVSIRAGQVEVQAELNDTATARAIAQALPIDAEGRRWGGEIYFSIPVEAGLEGGARDLLAHPVLAYFDSPWGRCPQILEVLRFWPIA